MKNKKIKRETDGIVYSTEPDFAFKDLLQGLLPKEEEESDSSMPKLNIRMEKKGRGGKTVTVIEGFSGSEDALKDLEKKLKTHCGTGGSSGNSEILIQGDQRKKVMEFLQKLGYKTNKAI
jgi:translation initiation factor 1